MTTEYIRVSDSGTTLESWNHAVAVAKARGYEVKADNSRVFNPAFNKLVGAWVCRGSYRGWWMEYICYE